MLSVSQIGRGKNVAFFFEKIRLFSGNPLLSLGQMADLFSFFKGNSMEGESDLERKRGFNRWTHFRIIIKVFSHVRTGKLWTGKTCFCFCLCK